MQVSMIITHSYKVQTLVTDMLLEIVVQVGCISSTGSLSQAIRLHT